ncbi:MAG: nitrilase-related carbon-nitrogen hydrolase [Eudoraea sp.]|uniref:nitrilase-related carbon-nitrogen hydrolase n=1 Tax=Eudoraea sp. TaxID=1979955 RepID=UPI003263F2B0
MKTLKRYLSNPYLVLFLGMFFMILGSAKWTVFIGPWLGLAFFLYFMRKVKLWKAIVFGFLGLYVSGFIGAYEVFPAPIPILAVIFLVISFQALLPYLVDRLSKAQEKGFWGTLIFPAAFVVMEYLIIMHGGDAWKSIANTQYQFQALQQIASVLGIWGISFLIAWFASLVNWMSIRQWKWSLIRTGSLLAGSIYLLIIAFGTVRLAFVEYKESETVKIAGITVDNTNISETIYLDEFGETITITPETSQTAPELQEANRAMVPFIEDPFAKKFENSRKALKANLELLFDNTSRMADKGAKIIVWSEAIGLIVNSQEDGVIERAKTIAKEKQIYLFISLGVINPGPYNPERLLLVNKTITLNPEGEVANIYLKSNPVPFAEQEYGSDDIIPVISSPYGRLSPVICYDADFPNFLKQTGKKGTDILLVPSGDWKAIDPYHAYMSSLRGIENGVSVFRPVSRATSIATDPYGNLLGSSNFFTSKEKILMANVPIKGINTLYNRIGDALPYMAMVFIAYILFEMLLKIFKKEKTATNKQKTKVVGV